MAKSTKPRHKQRQKRMLVPMMKESRDSLATFLHTNVETAILAPSHETLSALSKKLAIFSAAINDQSKIKIKFRKDSQSLAIVQMESILTSIESRYERTGRWGMTGDEANGLRATAGVLDIGLAKIPLNVFEGARQWVHAMMKHNKALEVDNV